MESPQGNLHFFNSGKAICFVSNLPTMLGLRKVEIKWQMCWSCVRGHKVWHFEHDNWEKLRGREGFVGWRGLLILKNYLVTVFILYFYLIWVWQIPGLLWRLPFLVYQCNFFPQHLSCLLLGVFNTSPRNCAFFLMGLRFHLGFSFFFLLLVMPDFFWAHFDQKFWMKLPLESPTPSCRLYDAFERQPGLRWKGRDWSSKWAMKNTIITGDS